MRHVNTIESRRTFSFTFTRSNRKRPFWETRLSHKNQTLCFWPLINPTSNRLGLLQWDSTSTTDNEHSHSQGAHTHTHTCTQTHISSASALLLILVCLHKHVPPWRRWLTSIQRIHVKNKKDSQTANRNKCYSFSRFFPQGSNVAGLQENLMR